MNLSWKGKACSSFLSELCATSNLESVKVFCQSRSNQLGSRWHEYTVLARETTTWSAYRVCWPQVVGLLEYASVHILDAIAMSTHLGLTAGAFKGIIDTPSQTPSSSSLDVIQYLSVDETVPPCKPEGGCALHHDRGLLTLIWSDTVEGLQVYLMLPFHPYKHALFIGNYA